MHHLTCASFPGLFAFGSLACLTDKAEPMKIKQDFTQLESAAGGVCTVFRVGDEKVHGPIHPFIHLTCIEPHLLLTANGRLSSREREEVPTFVELMFESADDQVHGCEGRQ